MQSTRVVHEIEPKRPHRSRTRRALWLAFLPAIAACGAPAEPSSREKIAADQERLTGAIGTASPTLPRPGGTVTAPLPIVARPFPIVVLPFPIPTKPTGQPDPTAAIQLLKTAGSLPGDVKDPDVPAPTLAWFDPAVILGINGPVDQTWLFQVHGERSADVYVALDGSAIKGVVFRGNYESPLTASTMPRFTLDPVTGVPNFVSFTPPLRLPSVSTNDPVEVAYRYFETFRAMFGTGAPRKQLALVRVDTDLDGGKHVVFAQLVGNNNVPVWGAELRVHMDSGLAITSIAGRYYRDPEVALQPTVSEGAAAQAAALACSSVFDGDANGSSNTLNPEGLAIFPLRFVDPAAVNHLTWRFECGGILQFVSAQTGKLVFSMPLGRAERDIYDAEARYDTDIKGPVQLRDGVEQVPVADLDPDARIADANVLLTKAFWALFGRTGLLGNDVVYVDTIFWAKNNPPETNAAWSHRGYAMFSPGWTVLDVVGHELTHGLTQATSGLVYVGEPGALNESLSDVAGELIEGPGTNGKKWQVGETLPNGALRDMANPDVRRYSEYVVARFDALNDYGGVHTNSGIINMAAVRLCDGDGAAHPGIGRSRLARLWYEVQTTRLTPWSTFIDFALNTWEVGRELGVLGRLGVPVGGLTPGAFDPSIGNEVLWAFHEVELDPRYFAGWYAVPGNQTTEHVFAKGDKTSASEVVSDVTVRLQRLRTDGTPIFNGVLQVSTQMLTGTFADDLVTGTITQHGVGTQDLEVHAVVASSNFSDIMVSEQPTVSPAPGANPPPPTLPLETPRIAHWFDNPFFAGRKYGDALYGGASLPAGCTVDSVKLELIDKNGTILDTNTINSTAAVSPGIGAYLTTVPGQGSSNLETIVRSWHEFGRIVRYRLVYWVTGNGCSLPPLSIK